MKRLPLVLLLLLPLAAQSHKKTETFWQKLLRIAGVSATPASLRGDEHVTAGDVWLIPATQTPAPRRLTTGGAYSSPVFDAPGQNIFALRAGDLYRIPLDGGVATKLHAIAGVKKLVGVSRDDPDQLLVLAEDDQHSPYAALVSIRAGTMTRIPHDPVSSEDQVMLAHLAGWDRVYGDTRLYTEKNEMEGAGGSTITFTDVYLKRGNDPPVNLTKGTGVSSSQPSLSSDGRQVAFIRKGR